MVNRLDNWTYNVRGDYRGKNYLLGDATVVDPSLATQRVLQNVHVGSFILPVEEIELLEGDVLTTKTGTQWVLGKSAVQMNYDSGSW